MSSPQFVHPKSEEDPVLSPIFLSSADDVTSTSSSSNSSSHESGSPRNDWILPSNVNVDIANLPSLWSASGPLNQFTNLPYPSSDHWATMDFGSDLTSFLPDTSHPFSIDPTALHFGSHGHVYGGCETNANEQDTLVAGCDPASQFSFSRSLSNQFASPMSSEIGLDVRHVLTPMSASVVSSMSRSPSPPNTPAYGLHDTGINPTELSLISQRAREAAGVTSAILVNVNTNARLPTNTTTITQNQAPELSLSYVSNGTNASHIAGSPKVAIPRLRPPSSGPLSSSLPVDVSASICQNDMVTSQDNTQSQPPHVTKTGRPKTSHTTIERRYRTNLNARILALRRAVPALRVLEKNITDSGITQGKGLTGATAPKAEFNDVINERGYVDGVKAAKKNSKGVVLGKAVEYIKALKRREIRLRRETDGLKALLLGLVGGSELLIEWEKEWRSKFGGEELDEIEEDAGDDMDGDGDDGGEGDEDEDDEGDEEDLDLGRKSRPRKRGKPDTPAVKPSDKKSPSATTMSGPQTGEKRKRGRPRKIQTPPTNVGVPKLVLHPPSIMSPGMQQIQPEPPKYLLAAFVLFNLFSNSPFSSTSPSTSTHSHEGTVLTHQIVGTANTSSNVSNWPWLLFQLINSLVSILLLVYLFSDGAMNRMPFQMLGFGVPKSQVVEKEESRQPPRMGVLGLVKIAMMRCVTNVHASNHNNNSKAWRPIAEAMVLNSSSSSLISAVQAYLSFSSVIAPNVTQFSDHITLALLSHTFSLSTAQKRWASLQVVADKPGTNVSAPERLALSLNLAEAVRILEETREACFVNDTPVTKLARYVILESTKKLAVEEWLTCVSSSEDVVHLGEDSVQDYTSMSTPLSQLCNSPQKPLVFEAGKQLGGKIGELVLMLERCHASPRESEREIETFEESDEQESRSSTSSSEEIFGEFSGQDPQLEKIEETRSMLLATVLYKQIFSQISVSDKHGPVSINNLSNIMALRRTLASAAFDCCPETDYARDKVVDILAEMSRASKLR